MPATKNARRTPTGGERAQPLFERRTEAPKRWRPSRVTRWLLGLVPGVRTMAVDDVRRGLVPAAAGLALALAFALVAAGWASSQAGLARLRVVESFTLFDGACLLALALAYEGLRLVMDLEERRRRPAAPRVVAAPFLPAALLVGVLPGLVVHAPRALEPLWWSSLLLAAGSSAAVLWCMFEDAVHTRAARQKLVLGWAAGITALLALVALVAAFAPGVAREWATAASRQGFVLLPTVLTFGRG